MMSQEQQKSGQHKCEQCNKTFNSEHELREHREKEHKAQSQGAGQGQRHQQRNG